MLRWAVMKFLHTVLAAATAVTLGAAVNAAPKPSPTRPKTERPPSAPAVAPADPVEAEYEKILEADDVAQQEVDKWIRDNDAFAAKGGGIPAAELNRRIDARFKPVREAYESFIAKHPRHARVRVAYASFMGDLGDEEGAQAQLEKALEVDTNNPAVYNNLANIYGHIGPVKKAFEFYTRAIDLNPREPVYLHNFATTVYLFRKDAREHYGIDEQQVFDKAMDLYKRALALDPTNFPLASDVAQTYYGIKPPRTDEALGLWTNAFNIARDEIEREGVQIHFARVKLMAGRFDEARNHLALVTNEMYAELKRRVSRSLEERLAEARSEARAGGSP